MAGVVLSWLGGRGIASRLMRSPSPRLISRASKDGEAVDTTNRAEECKNLVRAGRRSAHKHEAHLGQGPGDPALACRGASYGQIEARYGIRCQWAIAIVKGRTWKVGAADHDVLK